MGRLGLTCVHCHVSNRLQWGPALVARGAQLGALWRPRGVGWERDWREVQEGGDVGIHTADSLRCTAETTQHCKETIPQVKKKKVPIL